MKVNNFDRLFAAVATPYRAGTFDVDEGALRKLLRQFLQPKVMQSGGGIVINPEAGEIYYLSRKEVVRNAEIAVEEAGDKVPVVSGVIAPTTKDCVAMARDLKSAGVDGVFLMPPIGAMDITTSWDSERYPEVWVDMAKEICDSVDLPTITHPVTTANPRYGRGLPLGPTLKMLQEVPQIVGWKMTYNYDGFRTIARALREFPRHISILCSAAFYYHEFLADGRIDGTLTGSFNYAMEPMLEHIQAWKRGDLETARRIWHSGLAELHEYVYSEYSRLHVRYKAACWIRGLIEDPSMRPPQPRIRVEEGRRLRELCERAGLSAISDAALERHFRAPVSVSV